MLGVDASWRFGLNWYDGVVAAAILYGTWSGFRRGLSGEIVRLVGLVLMVVLALSFYLPVGKWVRGATGWAEELASLAAFVGIAMSVYIVAAVVGTQIHRRLEKGRFAAVVENVGGVLAGMVRMAILMAWVTVLLSLTRSKFWNHQVVEESRFGSFVVAKFPSVAAVADRQFPEKMGILPDLKRREEPATEEAGTQKKP